LKKPSVCVLRTDGINCDEETFYAFEKAGGECRFVHINQLRRKELTLSSFHVLALPGGFSYGDDILSGKVLAVELISFLKEQLVGFVEAGKPVLGICNGFQVLVRTGLLPDLCPGTVKTTLMFNDSGRFECRWVNLLVEKSPSIFTKGMEGRLLCVQAAHKEGKFFTDASTLDVIEKRRQVVFRYAGADGRPTLDYPANPNGSLSAIAGICDPSGLVMGMMPHPERYVEVTQHPNWRRLNGNAEPHGLGIFKNAVAYARQM